jgi:ADP-ribose pyrophosphatase
MADLTETTRATETVYDGALLHVRRDDVELPDGNTSVREWIEHPGAAAVVPLMEDGGTLLVRQFRYPPRKTFLEVPAGKLDHEGESPEEVAARELEEEAGWRAGRLERVGAMHPCIGYSNEIIHVFAAYDLTKSEQDLEEGEFMEVVEMPFAEATRRAREGELMDAKTVVALTLVAAHVEKKRRTLRG